MDLDNLMSFLPLLIFILTIVIDKSYHRKKKKKRGHFPPLPDMGETEKNQNPYGTEKNGQSKKEPDTTVYNETSAAKTEAKIPWYIEFPEDREKKQQGRVYGEPEEQKNYQVYHGPVFTAPDAAAAKPVAAAHAFTVPRPKVRKPLFNGKMDRKRLREGIIMSQILDKPRALNPYKEPY